MRSKPPWTLPADDDAIAATRDNTSEHRRRGGGDLAYLWRGLESRRQIRACTWQAPCERHRHRDVAATVVAPPAHFR
jgi:diacylglycerol kinase family enzyme